MTTSDYLPTPHPLGFIQVGSLCVLVVKDYLDSYSAKKLDYLPAQALVQWAEADWDSAQVALQAENTRCLYGIREFLTPDIFGVTISKAAALYMRLDRSQRYLAHLCANRCLATDSVERHTAQQLVQRQQDWDQALAQYQHSQRALAWWRRCGLEEISEPGLNERRRQPRSKPTMIEELEMIHQLSEHGRYSQHNHSHSPHCHCRSSRPRNPQHGPF